MAQPASVLDFFARTHTAFLHARGRKGTFALIGLLDCRPGEQVLELGFGTGATLAWLAAAYPQTRFFGVERSALMIRKARQRLTCCGLQGRLDLVHSPQATVLPWPDRQFDKVYAESVLAIQEEQTLLRLLAEICRVLKPGGILLLNETIWLETVSLSEIHRVNTFCQSAFGIIQAVPRYPEDWRALLGNSGFTAVKIEKIGSDEPSVRMPLRYRLGSALYSLSGKMKKWLDPALRKAQRDYQAKMQAVWPDSAPRMEGLLLRAVKPQASREAADRKPSR